MPPRIGDAFQATTLPDVCHTKSGIGNVDDDGGVRIDMAKEEALRVADETSYSLCGGRKRRRTRRYLESQSSTNQGTSVTSKVFNSINFSGASHPSCARAVDKSHLN